MALTRDERRFFTNVKMEEHCWMYQGCTTSSGYGRIYVKRKSFTAHRFSWLMHHGGEIKRGTFVYHHCKNKKCVNPEHLYLAARRFKNELVE